MGIKNANIEDLKLGDRMVIRTYFGEWSDVTVARISATLVIMSDQSRWYRDLPNIPRHFVGQQRSGEPGRGDLWRYDDPEPWPQRRTEAAEKVRASIVPTIRNALYGVMDVASINKIKTVDQGVEAIEAARAALTALIAKVERLQSLTIRTEEGKNDHE
jgi:hypothetical protein